MAGPRDPTPLPDFVAFPTQWVPGTAATVDDAAALQAARLEKRRAKNRRKKRRQRDAAKRRRQDNAAAEVVAALLPAERAANSLPASPPARDASAAAIAEVVAALSPEERALNGLASVPAEGARPAAAATTDVPGPNNRSEGPSPGQKGRSGGPRTDDWPPTGGPPADDESTAALDYGSLPPPLYCRDDSSSDSSSVSAGWTTDGDPTAVSLPGNGSTDEPAGGAGSAGIPTTIPWFASAPADGARPAAAAATDGPPPGLKNRSEGPSPGPKSRSGGPRAIDGPPTGGPPGDDDSAATSGYGSMPSLYCRDDSSSDSSSASASWTGSMPPLYRGDASSSDSSQDAASWSTDGDPSVALLPCNSPDDGTPGGADGVRSAGIPAAISWLAATPVRRLMERRIVGRRRHCAPHRRAHRAVRDGDA